MSVCPNKNTPEWKALETSVGAFEAMRDFMEHDGEIRSPEIVQEKIKIRDGNVKETDVYINSAGETVRSNTEDVEKKLADEFGPVHRDSVYGQAIINDVGTNTLDETVNDSVEAIQLANRLAERLGIDYQMITADEALELTKEAKNPWNGEPAFFVGGRVYFVGDHLSTTRVFHEFSHPFVRNIAATNSNLFNKLYEQVVATPEGTLLVQEVEELYELETDSPLFMEEVIVKALAQSANDILNDLKTESAFSKAVNNIMYAIKQLIRKVFGQNAQVSKMDATTTIKELADILNASGAIEIDMDNVSQDDVVLYDKERKEYIEDLMSVEGNEIQALINRVFDISSRHIDTLNTNKNYDQLAAILTDDFKRGDLQEIKGNLQQYQDAVANLAKDTQNDMEYTRKRATALVNSLFRLDTVMEKILLHMQDIAKEGETIDNLHKAHYYNHLVTYWENFIVEAKDAMNDPNNGVPRNSPLVHLVADTERSIDRIKALSSSMYADGARDTLYNELLPMNQNIKARYDQMFDNLRKRNAPQERIDKLHSEYYGVTEKQLQRMNELQALRKQGVLNLTNQTELEKLERASAKGIAITPEKIEGLLKGEMGDANFFNSYLEGYLYNTDPVIGGLASYVKNKLNEVMATAQGKYNDFAKDLEPDLKAAGYNPIRPGQLGEDIGFIDKVAKRDEEGNLIERSVWTFLNPFKNYRYDYDKHKDNVEKAQFEYARTRTKESEQIFKTAVAERKDFLRKYFHQEYVSKFYNREKLFTKDQIGHDALYARNNIFERMRMLSEPASTETDMLDISDDLDLLWREYRQLHSMYNLDGTSKTGEEAEIAKRLRQYRDESRDFYEWKPRTGVFENSLRAYEQELVDAGNIEGSDMYKALRQEWLDKNTRVAVKQSYYDDVNKITSRMKEIYSKLPDTTQKELDQTGIWTDIHDLAGGFRDDDGQIDASKMSQQSVAKTKALEEKLIEMRNNYTSRNGLTKAENARLRELFDLKANGQWTKEAADEMAELYNKKETFGLSKWEIRELDNLQSQLAGLSSKIATEHYTDQLNDWLSKLDLTSNQKQFSNVDQLSANTFLEQIGLVRSLLSQNADFKTWFEKNHIETEVWDYQSSNVKPQWKRLHVWNINKPVSKSHMETYEIKDENGLVVEELKGLPAMKFYARVVKPEYRNERIVGVTTDNQGQWLPKTIAQGAADDRYINHDYEKMSKEKPELFKVLEKMKKHHLANQDGASYKSRLYLDYPRSRKSNLEVVQTTSLRDATGEKMTAVTLLAKRVKDFFYGAKDDAESGFNYNDEFDLVRMDMFDNEITSVPVHGLYDIDVEDVSTDITHTMMKYMLSVERQKQLVEISPVARAIQSVVNENDVKEIDKVNKFNFINRAIKTYKTKSGDSVRKKAVNNFIEREFEGKSMTGAVKDVKWLNNTAGLLFKRASFGFFAFNIPSALKNSYGAKFQGMIEASAGKYMNHASFQKGNAWSYATMGELSFGNQLYQKGAKSLRQQIVEVFDPSQDRFEDTFGEGLSRTVAKDAASMSWLYNFRRWVELQATLQIFGGMMYHKKVKQTMPDGSVKEIPYMDAWELVDEKIQLKEGVDPSEGITYNKDGEIQVGDTYKRYKNQVHQVMNNLQGAYAKFDQPEAQRYLVFRFLSYLRRYFTTMTTNRFGFSGRWYSPQPRMNPGLGEMQMGFYVQFLKLAKNTITDMGKNLQYMTPDEKSAALRVISELGLLLVTNVAMSLLFGWDPDDDEKFEKIRQRSGALPFPFVKKDPDRPDFNGWGYVENHMLFLLMNIRAENEQFIPSPGYGLDDYSAMLDMKSIAFGPTVQTYKDIFEDALDIVQGNESAYYKRQTGPYEWQQEGSAKIWAHMGRTLGLTGSALDPAKSIKGFQSVQARAR